MFHGFAAQRELPDLYRSAKVFLFPTLADVWGVVANEACAAGLPVIVSPHAGVAGELVRDDDVAALPAIVNSNQSASPAVVNPENLMEGGGADDGTVRTNRNGGEETS